MYYRLGSEKEKEDQDFRSIKDKIEYLTIVTNKVCAQVAIEDVEVIEQEGRRAHIFTKSEEYICYERVETLAPILVGRSFFRAKKTLVINFRMVKKIEKGEIHLRSGRVYCLGRNNYIKTKKAFRNYLLGYPPFSDSMGDPESIRNFIEKNEKFIA